MSLGLKGLPQGPNSVANVAMATKNKHAPHCGNCREFKYANAGHRLRELNFRIPPGFCYNKVNEREAAIQEACCKTMILTVVPF